MNPDDPSRQPTTRDGRPLNDAEAVLIDSFCSTPMPRLNVVTRVGFDAQRLRAYRCRIEYPVYGSQATAVFSAVERAV